MHIKLAIEEKKITLSLMEGENVIGEDIWEDANNLSREFFVRLEDLLQKCDKTREDIEKMELSVHIPKGFTTARIARTITKTMNFALAQRIIV